MGVTGTVQVGMWDEVMECVAEEHVLLKLASGQHEHIGLNIRDLGIAFNDV